MGTHVRTLQPSSSAPGFSANRASLATGCSRGSRGEADGYTTYVNAEPENEWTRHGHVVALASGMVSAQAACSLDEAFMLMRERAQVAGQSLYDIANAVVERRIRFA